MPDSTASTFTERPSNPVPTTASALSWGRRLATVAVALSIGSLTLAGCKKEPVAPAAPEAPAAAPAPAVESAPSAPTAPAADPAPPVPAEPNPAAAPGDAAAVAPEKPPAEKAPADLSDVVPSKPTREPRGTCARACNKTQKCGTTSESVADCFGRCMGALAAPDGPDAIPAKAAFVAGDQCADSPCSAFQACLDATSAREEAYLRHPPISPRAAEPECQSACELEKRCSPDIHDDRPSGFEGCLANCRLVLTHVDPRVAEERARWRTRVACAKGTEACDAIEACVAAALPAAPPTAAPSAPAEPAAPAAPVAPVEPAAAPTAPAAAPAEPAAAPTEPAAAPTEGAPTPP